MEKEKVINFLRGNVARDMDLDEFFGIQNDDPNPISPLVKEGNKRIYAIGNINFILTLKQITRADKPTFKILDVIATQPEGVEV